MNIWQNERIHVTVCNVIQDSFASWDFASNDPDPTPTNYFGDEPDRHGTSCAGEIAMAKDNNRCGVGVAYDSNIGCT